MIYRDGNGSGWVQVLSTCYSPPSKKICLITRWISEKKYLPIFFFYSINFK